MSRKSAQLFLKDFYGEFPEVQLLLNACRQVAEIAYQGSPTAGVMFTDPSDWTQVRWNPVARADRLVPNNGCKLTISLPGYLEKRLVPHTLGGDGEYAVPRRDVTIAEKDGSLKLSLPGQFLPAQTGQSPRYSLAGGALTVSARGHRLVITTMESEGIGQLVADTPTLTVSDNGQKLCFALPDRRLPEEVIQWAVAHAPEVTLSENGCQLRLSLPGRFIPGKITREFVAHQPDAHGEYPVDRRALKRMVPPCLIHLLDAYYSTLVMQRLHARGVRTFVGVHDCWLVPEKIKIGDDIMDGQALLREVMEDAAREWYQGLGSVYRELLGYLTPPPNPGKITGAAYASWQTRKKLSDAIRVAYEKWQRRVQQGYCPVFLAKTHR